MLTSLAHFLKKITQYRGFKYIFAAIIFIGGSCFAAQKDSDVVNAFIQILDLVFAFVSFLMTPAIILAGWLLTPDWTMGDFFGLRKYFIQVWVLVSNIVYIVFALILLAMAVIQIFGGGEAEYAFKQKLPKFLLGVLIVPFTWLIVSWTLSFANQATAAVLSIPMGAIANMQGPDVKKSDGTVDKGIFHEKIIPTEIELNFSDTGPTDPTKICESVTTSSDTRCISAAEFVTYNGSGPFFIIMVYAYNIFKIQSTTIVNLKDTCTVKEDGSVADSKTCIKNLTQILRQFGLAVIVTFFFSVLLIALCWVLLMRAFKLWIYVMFSPLFGLAIFTGEGLTGALHSEGGGGEGSGLSSVGFVPFFRLAFVPVLVSAVLSFGLLFIGVISDTFSATLTSADTSSTKEICTTGDFMVKYCIKPDGTDAETNEQGYSSWLVIGSDATTKNGGKANGTAGDYTIVFKFDSMFSGFMGNAQAQGGSIANGAVDSVESIFAHIILTLISLVVIWMGVKAAVNYDEVTRIAFEPFAKFGDSVQHMVAHLPSHLPLPHPAFAALSPSGISSIADGIEESLHKSRTEERQKIKEFFGSGAIRDGLSQLKDASGNLEKTADILRDNSAVRKSESAVGEISKTLKSGFEAIRGSATTAKDANGATLTVANLERKLQAAKTVADRNAVLSEFSPLIDEMKKSSNATEKKLGENLAILRGSSSGGSGGGTTVFNNVKIESGSDGNVTGIAPTGIKADEIRGADIRDHLSNQQRTKIRELAPKLKSTDERVRRDALSALGITVPEGDKRVSREGKIATALVEGAGS